MPFSRFTTNASTIYCWMARNVSSVSASRLFNASASSRVCRSSGLLFAITQPFPFLIVYISILILFTQVQSDEHAFGVRKITDDLLDRFRKFPHQGWDGKDLVTACQLGMLEQIDDFNLILPRQVLFTDLLQIGECGKTLRGLPGNIKPQLISLGCTARRRTRC